MATLPPLDLQTLPLIPSDQIVPAVTRLLAQVSPASPGLGYLTVNQLVSAFLSSALVLSAPGTLPAPIVASTLTEGDDLTFNIQEAVRSGYITGTSALAFGGDDNRISLDVISYDSVTGDLVTKVSGIPLGDDSIQVWSVSYSTATVTADTVGYNADPAYPAGTDTVQKALDRLGVITRGSVTSQTIIATDGQTNFTVPGGYNPYGLQIYRDREKLRPAEYSATNGTSFSVGSASTAGMAFEVVSFQPFVIANPLDAATLNGQPGTYYRNLSNTTGTIPDARLPDRLDSKQDSLPNTQDFNALQNSGWYFVQGGGSANNAPEATASYWINVLAVDVDNILQIAHQHVNTDITYRYIRKKVNGTWKAWVQDNPDPLWFKSGSDFVAKTTGPAGANVAKITAAGALIMKDNITAYGTP